MYRYILVVLVGLVSSSAFGGEIEGWVYDSETRHPLQAAGVSVLGTEMGTLTDAAGHFLLADLGAGEVSLEFSYLGYRTELRKVSLGERDRVSLSVVLSPTILQLEGIVVTATREPKDRGDVPIATNVVSRDLLQHRNIACMGPVFQQEAGVSVSTTGPGIVRPVIRGLYDSQVLTLWDGIPMMDLRPGGDHVLLLEPEQIERVEVVRGPGSVLYGSDAIGGVVNFITQPPNPFFRGTRDLDGGLQAGYGGLGGMVRANGHLALGSEKGYLMGRCGYKKSGNISDPDREIPNSSYKGRYVDLMGGFQREGYDGKLAYYRLVADVGVPLDPAIRHSVFEDEKQQFLKCSNVFSVPTSFLQTVEANLAYQRHNRHFHLIQPFAAKPDTFEQDMQIFVNVEGYSAQLIPTTILAKHAILKYGVDVMVQKAESDRKSFTIHGFTGSVTPLSPPRVFPDAQRSDVGVFLENETDLRRLSLFSGVRYDWVRARSFQTDRSPIVPSDKKDRSWTGNAGLIARLPSEVNLSTHVGRAFRSPTLLERYFWGPHQTTVDRGNPDLKPETSLNLDVGLNRKQGPYQWGVSLFRNVIRDYIYKQRTGEVENGMEVDTWLNVSEARLEGVELEAAFYPFSEVGGFANASYVRGTDTKKDEPLQSIPPLNGSVGIRYGGSLLKGELSTLWAAGQDRIAEKETETDGFVVFNASVGLSLARWLPFNAELNVNVDNLLDTNYKNHLSRVKQWYSEPGRNISLSLTTTQTPK
ncbi:MAG: TonB-dependent receptor [Candidatus Latescibacterota bacterium]